ncbi:TPA: hypothetical protein N0F65_008101 [Lagenidium giganteum]|uniref:Mitochondrial small ribosomal subunit Rsm22 n=1 Tax=Lagenidium giganteum TaxID=4803 RepID=A0AAV2Z0J2_9STRA|nr:TPA: hypothetical protein N0F65_008101 [Lagenidium giganteum]
MRVITSVQRAVPALVRASGAAQSLRQAPCHIQTLSFATSRRARRGRRAAAAGNDESKDEDTSLLAEMRERVRVLANIDEISRTGLIHRVEMPQELLERLTSITKRRTHSQLEQLRKNAAEEDVKFPLDMHKRPIGWTLEREKQIKPFVYGPMETMLYLAYDMEATYASMDQVFQQLQRKKPDFRPTSMLDFGAGPGTASWVAKNFYEHSIEKYRVVEPSQSMVDAAEVILEGFPGLGVRRSISEMKREIQTGVKYDLIVAGYVLSEITNDFERIAVVSALWELLSDDGVLVIADRGSPWGSHHVRSARQFIIDSVLEDAAEADESGETKESVRILAPCPHHFECPAAGGTWCHFVQRSPRVQFPRDATTKRWHGHKSSKFSYVVMEKNSSNQDTTPASASLARLIRGPLLATRHVHLDLCTPAGELERRSVTKRTAIREVYRASRKAHWGAEWPSDASIYRLNDNKDEE